ncbi:AAA family ATPase [Sinorhizobium meliloti]|uniref:AAA family ATPase n=1 Tax=Rhizobium meliloti TaxID=382 RepID=UPI001F37C820|nr:AAA family ATPase [Sinorhizobium meliloti]
MTAAQRKKFILNGHIAADDFDGVASVYYGIYDRLTDWGHSTANVVVAPAKEDGQPDWDRAGPTNLEKPSSDSGPADMAEVRRWAILADEIDGCDSATSLLLWLDPETGNPSMVQIAGPEADGDIAMRIIGRDIGAAPPPKEYKPGPLAASLLKLAEKMSPPPAANDNNPAKAAKAEKPAPFVDAETLLGMEFAPIKYVIPGYVAEGLTLLGGRPKLGKSWLALDFGIAVASGGQSLGVECVQGDALYLALEDNQRRLQDRLKVVLPKFKRPNMSRLSLLTEAPKIGAGLIEALDAWRRNVDDPRLIIVDTLAMVRQEKRRNQDAYSADYEALSPLQRFASEHRLAIVVVTHVRKAEAEDPLEMISGTNGLTGAADSIMILNRTADGPKLYGRGRDVEEVEKALKFDGGRWSVLGDVDDVKRSGERTQIIEALRTAASPMKPSEIAEATGMKAPNVSYLLRKMVAAGEAVKDGYGTYSSPPSSPSTPSSSTSHYPPSSVEADSDNGENLKDLEDLKGGTPSSDDNQQRRTA